MDVSVQAQIINLLLNLKEELNLTYIFISHDLAVVKFISDEICVMKNGKIVEQNPPEDIYKNPKNPYTKNSFTINSFPDPSLSFFFTRLGRLMVGYGF